jgi:hypothetical protein
MGLKFNSGPIFCFLPLLVLCFPLCTIVLLFVLLLSFSRCCSPLHVTLLLYCSHFCSTFCTTIIFFTSHYYFPLRVMLLFSSSHYCSPLRVTAFLFMLLGFPFCITVILFSYFSILSTRFFALLFSFSCCYCWCVVIR